MSLLTPDLEESLWFFRDVIGLKEAGREGKTAYLRGMRDRQHHTMRLTEASETGVDHVGWRCATPGSVEGFARKFERQGIDVTRIDDGEEPGIGDAIRFTAPQGHEYVFYYDVEKPDVPEEERSRLKNRGYRPDEGNRISPRRIDHVHVHDPAGDEHAEWLEDLGFDVRERFQGSDGEWWGWWMSVTSLPHDIAIRREGGEGGRAEFHHVAYHLDSLQDLWEAADVLRENGIVPDGGPGRHAITCADFLYVKDPASDIRIELFRGPGYLIFEPDWEPIDWVEGEIGTEEQHQWIGTQFSHDGIPYR